MARGLGGERAGPRREGRIKFAGGSRRGLGEGGQGPEGQAMLRHGSSAVRVGGR